jgi:hypothetical protein
MKLYVPILLTLYTTPFVIPAEAGIYVRQFFKVSTVVYIVLLILFSNLSFSQTDSISNVKDTLLIGGQRFPRPKPSTDPAADRLFYSANGKAQKDGIRVSVHLAYIKESLVPVIVFPGVNIGLFDVVSFGAGISVPPIGFYLFNAKVTPLKIYKTSISVGAFFIGYLPEGSDVVGIPYTAVTGDIDQVSLTGGIALPTVGGSPLIILGGDVKVTRGFKLMTENWLLFSFPGALSLSIFGGRFSFQQAAIDAGLAILTSLSEHSPGVVTLAPTVSLSVGF